LAATLLSPGYFRAEYCFHLNDSSLSRGKEEVPFIYQTAVPPLDLPTVDFLHKLTKERMG
jgi:hypothetical protein